MVMENCLHGKKDFTLIMSGNKIRIHFLSAADRINYGDLLFPILFKKVADELQLNYDFFNYGLVKSDFRHFGALPTSSYRKFQSNTKGTNDIVIVGGGEVFFADWKRLYAFISNVYVSLLKSTKFKILDQKLKIAERILCKGDVFLPFVLSKREFLGNDCKIFYNSVGGEFNSQKTKSYNGEIVSRLHEANYISVRDMRSRNSLSDYGINSQLSPDSALIMSDFYTLEILSKKISFSEEKISSDFLFVQLGKYKAPANIREFAFQLEKQLKKLNYKAILCPIGLAPNHEDQEVLKELSLCSDFFKLIIPNNIFDIMYLIAKSNGYLGTSLHGMITAQSFQVPFIPLNKKIKKLDSYSKTWAFNLIDGALEYDEVEKLVNIVESWDYETASENLVEQKKIVYENYKRIFSFI